MIRFYLIRHSITLGNLKKRYIGTTDEPLCEEGVNLLYAGMHPVADQVFTSPMRRCRQTADILYPGQEVMILPKLAECDFGEFENKNAEELKCNPQYQQWIDSMGTLPFPGGESREGFQARSIEGFLEALDFCEKHGIKKAALVVHGGTIMSIMEAFGRPREEYYYWQTKNAQGYVLDVCRDEERKYEMDADGGNAGLCDGPAPGGPQVAVPSGKAYWKTDFPGGKNYQKLSAQK